MPPANVAGAWQMGVRYRVVHMDTENRWGCLDLSASRRHGAGRGCVLQKSHDLAIVPSRAENIEHGFATVAIFFRERRRLPRG